MTARPKEIKSAASLLALLRENPSCRYVAYCSGEGPRHALFERSGPPHRHLGIISTHSEADQLLDRAYAFARGHGPDEPGEAPPIIYGVSCRHYALPDYHRDHGGDRERDAFDDWDLHFATIIAREPELVAWLEQGLARQAAEFHAIGEREGRSFKPGPPATQRSLVDDYIGTCWGAHLTQFQDGKGSFEEHRAALAEAILREEPAYAVFRDWRPGDPFPQDR